MKEIEEEELWKTVVFQTWRLLAYAPELSTNSSDSRDDVVVLFFVTLRSECM